MERRDFIVRSALATGAMALANHITLASNAGLDSIFSSTLSQSSTQVRHGLFQLRALTNLSFPKWLNVYEKQHLTANGIESSKDDLEVVMLEIKNEALTIGIQGEQFFYTTDQGIESAEIGSSKQLDVAGRQQRILSTRERQANGVIAADEFCFCLKGEASFASDKLEVNDFARFQKEEQVKLSPNSILLLIS